jgi:hypothetical protein
VFVTIHYCGKEFIEVVVVLSLYLFVLRQLNCLNRNRDETEERTEINDKDFCFPLLRINCFRYFGTTLTNPKCIHEDINISHSEICGIIRFRICCLSICNLKAKRLEYWKL